MLFSTSLKARQALGLKDCDLIGEQVQDAKSFNEWYCHLFTYILIPLHKRDFVDQLNNPKKLDDHTQ